MQNPIRQEQLAKIIAEVENIANKRKEDLDREEIKEILQELNFSPDLLEEAITQVQRREALGKQEKQKKWLTIGIAIIIVGAIATTTIFWQQNQQALQQISVYQSNVTLPSKEEITRVKRQDYPELYYRVTLEKAPIGKSLSLQCDWIDPQGNIAHQNHYETKTIDKQVWSTYCRYQVTNNTISGNWEVRLYLGDRLLSSNKFIVE
jgi:hypothetical protein